jgi:hypothetical protein
MPRSRAPAVVPPLLVERLRVKLELRVGKYKSKLRLLVELFDEDDVRRSQVLWLSDAPRSDD